MVGLVAGVLAKWAVPGEGPGGIIGDIITGGATGINVYSIIVAFVGAVVLLLILRAFGRRTA